MVLNVHRNREADDILAPLEGRKMLESVAWSVTGLLLEVLRALPASREVSRLSRDLTTVDGGLPLCSLRCFPCFSKLGWTPGLSPRRWPTRVNKVACARLVTSPRRPKVQPPVFWSEWHVSRWELDTQLFTNITLFEITVCIVFWTIVGIT